MKPVSEEAEVTLGADCVVIRRRGVSRVEVAGILELQQDGNGLPTRIVLDRRVHGPRVSRFGDWEVSGAVVSVLVRPGVADSADG